MVGNESLDDRVGDDRPEEEEIDQAGAVSRRALLAKLGFAVGLVYAAPTLLQLDDVEAGDDKKKKKNKDKKKDKKKECPRDYYSELYDSPAAVRARELAKARAAGRAKRTWFFRN